MNKINLYLPICLTVVMFTVFTSSFNSLRSMETEIEEASKVGFEQPSFETLPAELSLDIFLRNLDLENINVKELPLVLSEFWSFAQVCKPYRLIAENCLWVIIAQIYKRFGIEALITIWNSRIPKDHPIRNAILQFCQVNKNRILEKLDTSSYQLLDGAFDSYYKYRNGKCCQKLVKEKFLQIKFYLETDLVETKEKQKLLEKMQESLKRIRNKSLPFLVSII